MRGRPVNPQTTIDQIGKVTLMSVGARNFISAPDSLRFTVGRGDRIVTVTLDPDDTYSVRTQLKRTGRVIFEVSGIYCDQLAEQVYQAHLELNKRDRASA